MMLNKNEFINKVLMDYKTLDEELSSMYFDFYVRMKQKDIIEGYCELQKQINGDIIIRNENNIPYGNDGFIKDGEYEEVFEGYADHFLIAIGKTNIFSRYSDEEKLEFII